MTIGELNRRIEVQEFMNERDEYGGAVGNWVTVGKVWAKIEPSSGGQLGNSWQGLGKDRT